MILFQKDSAFIIAIDIAIKLTSLKNKNSCRHLATTCFKYKV